MTTDIKTEFDTYYAFLLKRVLSQSPEMNLRTGKLVKAVDGAFFRLGTFPILNLRDMNPLWTCTEAVWFMAGDSHVSFMRKFGFKNWDAFANEKMVVESATGFRWRKRFGVDQLNVLIAKLRSDRSNRQGVLLSWNPGDDLVNPGPNAPCVMIYHMHIIRGQLHLAVLQRSADLYFGLPHDILGARLVQELIAAVLEVLPGNLSYTVSNAHLYEDQWEAAQEMVYREELCCDKANYPAHLGLTPSACGRAMHGDPALVTELHGLIMDFYKPFPKIKGPSLVK